MSSEISEHISRVERIALNGNGQEYNFWTTRKFCMELVILRVMLFCPGYGNERISHQ